LCWQDRIFQTLKRLNSAGQNTRLVVMGIGHELRGDDAVGIHVVRKMRQSIPMTERLLLIDAGSVPENFCGTLRRYSPSLVVIIDSARMGLDPGEICWLDWKQVGELEFSTHAPTLLILAEYLVCELGCEIALLGIEPANMSLDSPLSTPVERAFQEVSSFMIDTLMDFSKPQINFVADRRFHSELTGSKSSRCSPHLLQNKEVNPL
jgi:hydrogenase 3 maturation protease